MFSTGVIERSDSDYGSLAVLAQSKDDSARFCTGYKKLNLLSNEVASLLPNS